MRSAAVLFWVFTVTAVIVIAPEVDAEERIEAREQNERNEDAQAIYLIYYWRAKPGKFAEYSDYIQRVAEPIDEEGRKAGVFEWVRTYTQVIQTGAPGSDWTHMRIFRLRNFASWDEFSAGLDAAALRAFPDEDKRRELMSPGPGLRDLVRQEIWRDMP